MKPEELKPWQEKFLEDLRKQDWTINEPPGKIEESEEEKTKKKIESASDYERLIIRPKTGNQFNNVSAQILCSKNLNKQIILKYKYKSLRRNGRLVGREGGIVKIKIEKYKKNKIEELELEYPIEEI